MYDVPPTCYSKSTSDISDRHRGRSVDIPRVESYVEEGRKEKKKEKKKKKKHKIKWEKKITNIVNANVFIEKTKGKEGK